MPVPVLKQGNVLIATVLSELSDAELLALRNELVERVGTQRARGVVVEVTALDVLDSYACRMLQGIVHAVKLRGARTVIAGIQPEVAFAMVQLGLQLDSVSTALDLEEALELLALRNTQRGAP